MFKYGTWRKEKSHGQCYTAMLNSLLRKGKRREEFVSYGPVKPIRLVGERVYISFWCGTHSFWCERVNISFLCGTHSFWCGTHLNKIPILQLLSGVRMNTCSLCFGINMPLQTPVLHYKKWGFTGLKDRLVKLSEHND